jgi:hypothetical protein
MSIKRNLLMLKTMVSEFNDNGLDRHSKPSRVYKAILIVRLILFSLKKRIRLFLDPRLNRYSRNIYSQNGEDGIIQEILHRLQIAGGWVVEFGAWDGITYSNTFRLIQSNGNHFRAVYIEGDRYRFTELQRTAETKAKGRIIPICAFIQQSGSDCLDTILSHTPVPIDFELLSIDVDGMDYYIWESFKQYYPKIVVIEINSSFPSDIEYLHGHGEKPGSSFLSMLKLAQKKGYTLVCHTGNMIFVRNDLVPKVLLQSEYLHHPENLFVTNWL